MSAQPTVQQRPTTCHQPPPATRPGGFTLLEVLLAVAITGFVLAAASTLLVSVTNIWSSRLDHNSFEDHVDGVAEFVQSSFTRAGMEIALGDSQTTAPENDAPNQNLDENTNIPEISMQIGDKRTTGNTRAGPSGTGLLRQSEAPIGWAEPPGFAGYRDPLLNFKLREQTPLLVSIDGAPVSGVDAFLYFDRNEGLSLLWYSLLQEDVENENDLRRTQLSPYVREMRLIYWDERFERWEDETEPKEGETDEFLLPRFIKLVFEKDEIILERTISIPVPSRSILLF